MVLGAAGVRRHAVAKLFYTLEEAVEKLGMTEDQVKELVASGKLGEYRDRDRLMFKVDQVDLLALAARWPDKGLPPAPRRRGLNAAECRLLRLLEPRGSRRRSNR